MYMYIHYSLGSRPAHVWRWNTHTHSVGKAWNWDYVVSWRMMHLLSLNCVIWTAYVHEAIRNGQKVAEYMYIDSIRTCHACTWLKSMYMCIYMYIVHMHAHIMYTVCQLGLSGSGSLLSVGSTYGESGVHVRVVGFVRAIHRHSQDALGQVKDTIHRRILSLHLRELMVATHTCSCVQSVSNVV